MSEPIDQDSVVLYRVGGSLYPLKIVPQCKLCTSPQRTDIENFILMGYPWSTIAESLSPQSGLTSRNIKEHFRRGHMPVPEAQRRSLIESRAAYKQINTDDPQAILVDHDVVMSTIMQKGFEALVTGRIVPEMKDVIAATKEVARIEASSADDTHTIRPDTVGMILFAVQRIMREQGAERGWDLLMREMNSNPDMHFVKTNIVETSQGELGPGE